MAIVTRTVVLKGFNLVQYSPILSFIARNGKNGQLAIERSCNVCCNMYASDAKNEQSAMGIGAPLNPKKKKVFIPRITLWSEDNEISVVTLEMAEKIAKRRNLKLVKVVDFDTRTERATYKLMTTKAFLEEDTKRKNVAQRKRHTDIKPEKLMYLSSKISEHDLQTKMNSVVKLLGKRHEVRIIVNIEGDKSAVQPMVNAIMATVKDLHINTRKTEAKSFIKFYLVPIIDDEESKTEKETNDSSPLDEAERK